MKQLNLILTIFLITAFSMSLTAQHSGHSQSGHAKSEASASMLPGENERISIDKNHYFTYSFDKKPAVGTVTLTVKVFNSKNEQITPFKIFANLDMPSMRGAHSSSDLEFQIKSNEYVLPIRIMMRGQWETLIKIENSGGEIFKGALQFRV